MPKKRKVEMPYGPVEVESRPRSRASLNLDKRHGRALPAVKIGQNHSMTVRGKVTSVSSDEYGSRMEMEVQPRGIKHGSEPSSLTQALKMRRMNRER